MTFDEIKAMVYELESEWEEGDEENNPAFKVAVLLLSAVEVGTTVLALRKFTRYSHRFVRKVWGRLRANGVFKGPERGIGKRVIVCDWNNEETGTISFWLDVLIGTGCVERVSKDGEPAYQKKE